MSLKIRRGLEADRTTFTPDEGELLWVTDTQMFYVGDGSTAGGILVGGGGGTGDVVGPGSATDNAIVLFDGTTGKLIKDSGILLSAKQDTLTDVNFGTFEVGLTGKTTPLDADALPITDSADSNKAKKVTFTNLKAFLKTYFDGIYTTAAAVATQISTALTAYLPLAGGSMSGSINEAKGSDVASAGTTNIGAATGNYINVTGTTTITAFDTIQAGTRRIVKFTGALTLTHDGTSLILPGAANILTIAGDHAVFVSLGSGNWVCVQYFRGTVLPVLRAQTINFNHSALGPADATSYFYAGMASTAATVTSAIRKKTSSFDGHVTSVSMLVAVAGTLGSNETATLKINNTTAGTSVTVFTTVRYDATGQLYNLILPTPFAVAAGDALECQVDMPTFVTNPTLVVHYTDVNISQR